MLYGVTQFQCFGVAALAALVKVHSYTCMPYLCYPFDVFRVMRVNFDSGTDTVQITCTVVI